MVDKIYSQIFKCDKCESLYKLDANKVRFKYGGNINADIMWIAQNPGYVIDKKTLSVFPLIKNNNKQQDEFTLFLDKIGLYKRSYFTNVIKCATKNNRKPNNIETRNCVNYLYEEILIIRPKIIFTLGMYSKDIITKMKYMLDNSIKFKHLYHPTYIFSYNRNLIDEYKKNIKNIFFK